MTAAINNNMRLPKRDQSLLAEAYDTVTTAAANSTRSMAYNTSRQLNRIENLLQQQGFKPADMENIKSSDGRYSIVPYEKSRDHDFHVGVILEHGTDYNYKFLGLTQFDQSNLKKAKQEMDGKFTTLEDLKKFSMTVINPVDSVQWLNTGEPVSTGYYDPKIQFS